MTKRWTETGGSEDRQDSRHGARPLDQSTAINRPSQSRLRRPLPEPTDRLLHGVVVNAEVKADRLHGAARNAHLCRLSGDPLVHRGLGRIQQLKGEDVIEQGSKALRSRPNSLNPVFSTVSRRLEPAKKTRWTRKTKCVRIRRTMTMGEIRASVTLENSTDREIVYRGHGVEVDVRRTTVEGIVDTGAVSLVPPRERSRQQKPCDATATRTPSTSTSVRCSAEPPARGTEAGARTPARHSVKTS